MPYYILKKGTESISYTNMKENQACKSDSCTGIIYADGLCRYHYKISSWKPIKNQTKKRSKEEAKYLSNRSNFIESKKDKYGRLYCIFCNKSISQDPDLHHGLGREGITLLDESHWFLAHNFCHVQQYHSCSWRNIEWWNDYILRIEKLDPEVYKQDSLRMNKS